MRLDITVANHEVDEQLWQKIKSFIEAEEGSFKISIEIEKEEAEDETTFLLKNKKNRERLLEAIEDVKQGKNLTTFTSLEELKKSL